MNNTNTMLTKSLYCLNYPHPYLMRLLPGLISIFVLHQATGTQYLLLLHNNLCRSSACPILYKTQRAMSNIYIYMYRYHTIYILNTNYLITKRLPVYKRTYQSTHAAVPRSTGYFQPFLSSGDLLMVLKSC